MAAAITLLLACQLIGEAINRLTGLPLPGAVIGMFLLLAWLKLRPGERVELKAVAGWLIAHFSILFVPATMGLVDQGLALSAHGIAIIAACVASTLLTIAVTAFTFQRTAQASGDEA